MSTADFVDSKGLTLLELLRQEAESIPEECNLTSCQFTLTNGVPHCGSEENGDLLPPGVAVKVNSDAILCSENTVLRAAMKAPEVSAIFKMVKSFSDTPTLDGFSVSNSRRDYIKSEFDSAIVRMGWGVDSGRSIEAQLPMTNKYLYLDDDAFQRSLREKLANEPSLRQYADDGRQQPYGTWSTVLVHGVGTNTTVGDTLALNPNVRNQRTTNDNVHVFHGHDGASDGVDSSFSQNRTMLFTSELGFGGQVGLYAKKLKSADAKWKFLRKFEDSVNGMKVKGNMKKTFTFSSYAYKYYFIIHSGAPHIKKREYEDMVGGLSLNELREHGLIESSTVESFVTSSYYGLYLKTVLENARRVVFAFARNVDCGVIMVHPKFKNPHGINVPSPSEYKSHAEVVITRHDEPWLKRLRVLDEKQHARDAILDSDHDHSLLEEWKALEVTIKEETLTGGESAETSRSDWLWKKDTMKVSRSVGYPAMAMEKKTSRQFTHTAQLHVDSESRSVFLHGDTVTLSMKTHNVSQGGVLPKPVTFVQNPVFRLPAVRGFMKAKLDPKIRINDKQEDYTHQIHLRTSLKYEPEATFKYIESNGTLGDFNRPDNLNIIHYGIFFCSKRAKVSDVSNCFHSQPSTDIFTNLNEVMTMENESSSSSSSSSSDGEDGVTSIRLSESEILKEYSREVEQMEGSLRKDKIQKAKQLYKKGERENPFKYIKNHMNHVKTKRTLLSTTNDAPEVDIEWNSQTVTPIFTALSRVPTPHHIEGENIDPYVELAKYAAVVHHALFSSIDMREYMKSNGNLEILNDLLRDKSEYVMVDEPASAVDTIRKALIGSHWLSLSKDGKDKLLTASEETRTTGLVISREAVRDHVQLGHYQPVCAVLALNIPPTLIS